MRVVFSRNDSFPPSITAKFFDASVPVTIRTAACRAIAWAMYGTCRRHFEMRDREGNKNGWPRTHFWRRVVSAAASASISSGRSASVTVFSPEFARKVRPRNPMRPRHAKMLAIPLTAEAAGYGGPRNYSGGERLFVFTSKRGNKILGYATSAGLEPLWVLKYSVIHRPDKMPWPSTASLLSAVSGIVGIYNAIATKKKVLTRIMRRR